MMRKSILVSVLMVAVIVIYSINVFGGDNINHTLD